jgi:hypothetical protein
MLIRALHWPHFGCRCCLAAEILFFLPQDEQVTITVFTKPPPEIHINPRKTGTAHATMHEMQLMP